jgi:hypothetical protein
MTINRNNYEIYFLDFFEGKLDAKLEEELMQFLELNYDLKEEFDAFENITLPPEKNIVFENKDKLKKNIIVAFASITPENYQEKLIAALEGDLNEEEFTELNMFMELNPALKKEQELFSKTRIAPDTSIVFEDKALLKKNVIVPFGAINASNYQEYMIAMIEGDFDCAGEKEFSEFMILNLGLKKEFSLFEQTKVEPDTSVVYEAKEQLKRQIEPVPVYTLNPAARPINVFRLRNILIPLSIAASVIIILSVYFKLNSVDLSKGHCIAYNSSIDINREISSGQNNRIDFNNDNSATAVNSSSVNKNTINSGSILFANNTEKPERCHTLESSPIAAPVKNQGNFESDDTYSELYAIILEKRNSQEPVQKKDDHYYSLDQYALYNVKKSLKPREERANVKPNDKFSIWDVADAGIRGFNNLTGADAKLNHAKDNSFSLALGDGFSYSRKGKK